MKKFGKQCKRKWTKKKTGEKIKGKKDNNNKRMKRKI